MHYRGSLLLALSFLSSLFLSPVSLSLSASFSSPSSLPAVSFFLRSISYRFPLPFGGKNARPPVHGDALPAASL